MIYIYKSQIVKSRSALPKSGIGTSLKKRNHYAFLIAFPKDFSHETVVQHDHSIILHGFF